MLKVASLGFAKQIEKGEPEFEETEKITEIYCLDGVYGKVVDIDPDRPLMQFTGLLDRHGKEIYEGDILNCSGWGEGRNGEDVPTASYKQVMFKHGCFIATSIHESKYDEMDDYKTTQVCLLIHQAAYPDSYPCEVIGNVHENPDLVEQSS